MAYYYFINSGTTPLASIDHSQAFFPTYGQLYPQGEDFGSGSLIAWAWPQTEVFQPKDLCLTRNSSVAAEQVPVQMVASTGVPPKKRRAQKTLEKEVISAKKNSESNLINQFYSFFGSRDKSERVVEKCCALLAKTGESDRILPLFYSAIGHINAKRGRKYVNAALLLKFFTPKEFGSYLPEFKQKIDLCEFLRLDELCEIFRRCTMYFLKNISACAILTSKRISIVSKEEHIKKRRRVQRTVLEL